MKSTPEWASAIDEMGVCDRKAAVIISQGSLVDVKPIRTGKKNRRRVLFILPAYWWQNIHSNGLSLIDAHAAWAHCQPLMLDPQTGKAIPTTRLFILDCDHIHGVEGMDIAIESRCLITPIGVKGNFIIRRVSLVHFAGEWFGSVDGMEAAVNKAVAAFESLIERGKM